MESGPHSCTHLGPRLCEVREVREVRELRPAGVMGPWSMLGLQCGGHTGVLTSAIHVSHVSSGHSQVLGTLQQVQALGRVVMLGGHH